MPLYKSEDNANRALVYGLYFDEKKQLRDESFSQLLEDVYKAHGEILTMLEDPSTRLNIIEAVLDRSAYLAIWKIINPKTEWYRFISHLRAKNISDRNKTKINQIVEEAFLVLLEDAKEMEQEEVHEIYGIKDIQILQGSKGITARIRYV